MVLDKICQNACPFSLRKVLYVLFFSRISTLFPFFGRYPKGRQAKNLKIPYLRVFKKGISA
jgi:hypothetical protein